MNLIQARKAVDYFNTIKTQTYKTVYIGFIRDAEDIAKYGYFAVNIKDEKSGDISSYYALTRHNYKALHEEVRTDFSKVHRICGHIFYRT